jgi:hypothetical protein
MMGNSSFQQRLKAHQVSWAEANGLADKTEANSKRPWVLKHEHQAFNLFDPNWWTYIGGKEHRWARALNSSQCFAVNLFAPLIENPALAKAVYTCLLPDRPLEPDDEIVVELEYSPEQARQWLGERRQQTQVDAAFAILRDGKVVGHLLVEVKLGETTFGTCRGAKAAVKNSRGNPNPEHCQNLAGVLAKPEEFCWLTSTEGRRYWTYITSPNSPFDFSKLNVGSPCPFSGGLYQPMRNRILADALVAETDATWSDFAVTVHPDNEVAHVLSEEVGGETDVISAFRLLVGGNGVRIIEPGDLLSAACNADDTLSEWADWMVGRYIL